MPVSSPDNCTLVASFPFGAAFEIRGVDRDDGGRVMAIALSRIDDWSGNMPEMIRWDVAERWAWGPGSRLYRPLDYEQLEGLNRWDVGQRVGVFYDHDINGLEEVQPPDDMRLFVETENGAYSNGFMFTRTPTSLEAIGAIMRRGYEELGRGEACTVTATEDTTLVQATPEDEFTYIDEMPPGIPVDPDTELPQGD